MRSENRESEITVPEGIRRNIQASHAGVLSVLETIRATQIDGRSDFSGALGMAGAFIMMRLGRPELVAEIESQCQTCLLEIVSGPLANLFQKFSAESPFSKLLAETRTESNIVANPATAKFSEMFKAGGF